MFVVAFVRRPCYVDNEAAFLLDSAHTLQMLDGGHVECKRRVDQVALLGRQNVVVDVVAAGQVEKRSRMRRWLSLSLNHEILDDGFLYVTMCCLYGDHFEAP